MYILFYFQLADKMVYRKVKDELGFGQTRSFFSAAAPLSEEVLDYFMSLDIKILEIYGMSEISGPQTGNDYQNYRWYIDYVIIFLSELNKEFFGTFLNRNVDQNYTRMGTYINQLHEDL